MNTWTEGWLPDGTHIHVDRDPYTAGGDLRVNGEIVQPVENALDRAVSRMRDGGSTYVRTPLGTLYCHRRLRSEHYDSWNGERLLAEKPDTLREVGP